MVDRRRPEAYREMMRRMAALPASVEVGVVTMADVPRREWMKHRLLAGLIGCALLAGGTAIAAADQSDKTMDQVARQACSECHGQCSLRAISCREQACGDAGGSKEAGACGGGADDPKRLVAEQKCASAVDACHKSCAATLLCQMTQ
jgi:hypothetical protein